MDNYHLQAPSVHFFAFQLCSSPDEKEEKDYLLWNHCDEMFRKLKISPKAKTSDILKLTAHLNLQPAASQSRSYLLKDEKHTLEFKGEVPFNNSCLTIDGFVSPQKLYDSYGLWLNIRRPEPYKSGEGPESPEFFKLFNPDSCLLILEDDNYQNSNTSPFLGQIIVITAKLSEDVKTRIQEYNDKKKGEELQKIADECLKYLFHEKSTNLNLSCINQEKLFESHCFEYNSFNQKFNGLNVIVWFFEKDETDDNFKKSTLQLFEIFFYRIKIIKAYNDGFRVSKELNELLQEIRKKIILLAKFNNKTNEISELDPFQEELKKLLKLGIVYSEKLFFVQKCEQNIEINNHNYNEIIKQISEITSEQKENLSFLNSFSDNCLIYQKQLRSQLASLRSGTDLTDRLINSIRGIVEIEKARIEQNLEKRLKKQEESQKKREDRLEQTIQIVGIGLGSAGVASSSTPFLIKQNPSKYPQNFVYSFIVSLIIGIVFALITLALLTFVRRFTLKCTKEKESKGTK